MSHSLISGFGEVACLGSHIAIFELASLAMHAAFEMDGLIVTGSGCTRAEFLIFSFLHPLEMDYTILQLNSARGAKA